MIVNKKTVINKRVYTPRLDHEKQVTTIWFIISKWWEHFLDSIQKKYI